VPATECSTNPHMVCTRRLAKIGLREARGAGSGEIGSSEKGRCEAEARSEWRYIGKGTASYDLKRYVHRQSRATDRIRAWRGMLYASVARPPVLGSSVKSVDDKAALSVAGVKQTAKIDAFKPPIGFQALGGVAVLADNTWSAMQDGKS